MVNKLLDTLKSVGPNLKEKIALVQKATQQAKKLKGKDLTKEEMETLLGFKKKL